jgi:hypothetical protein
MQFSSARVRQGIQYFDFKTLFIEELGWDRYSEQLRVSTGKLSLSLGGVAKKRDFVVLHCPIPASGRFPDYSERRKIERQVEKLRREHIIIYTGCPEHTQVWQWVKREVGKPAACREHMFTRGQSGEALAQKLTNVAFTLDEEDNLTLFAVSSRTRVAFDLERMTKRFYEQFRAEHAAFLKFLKGIPDEEMQRWYASVMINRLMFNYFIQKKGFLDGDINYLRTKLGKTQQKGKNLFYSTLLCPLFFDGFAKKPSERSTAVNTLLGSVPYLNGGLFEQHEVERLYGKQIQVADAAFDRLFAFFEQYQWHLDERPNRRDNEINPDVLGYIFEKYINQKQMGAYYTKEDITGYIAQNTIIPRLLDAVQKESPTSAFKGEASIWRLLRDDPDRYIYATLRKGTELQLPPDIARGTKSIGQRELWNRPASAE